jgi:hypothetical protein
LADMHKDPAPSRPIGWRAGVEGEVHRLRLEMARVQVPTDDDRVTSAILDEIALALKNAEFIVQEQPTRWQRLGDAWAGTRFEAAVAELHRAREGLLLILPSSAVLARIPDLRAGVKVRLPVTDPRFDGFMRLLDDLERTANAEPDQALSGSPNPASTTRQGHGSTLGQAAPERSPPPVSGT